MGYKRAGYRVLPVEVEANRESPTRTTVEARDFELVVDEPDDMGGTNEGPNPLEFLLAGQAGCLNVTATKVATDMGIELEDLEITIEGDFDVEAFQTEAPRRANCRSEHRSEAGSRRQYGRRDAGGVG